jgi:glycosyltransferase involved in cell wall biosynthesis
MNILLWHVHGSWTTAFVQGPHRYLVPVLPDRGPDGRGRARTWDWPSSVVEIDRASAAEMDVDVVVLQRREDEALAGDWMGGRAAGRDVPAVWLEHNAPQGRVQEMAHPAHDRADLTVVHVTHTNALFWDTGMARTRVIEHGIIDPGHRYTGEMPRAAVVVNEPVRRSRVAGTDLLPRFARSAPLDVFGMGVGWLACEPWFDCTRVGLYDDLPQARLHAQLAHRRAYLHPYRWTSLGLSLIEAMHLGMPIVALATTEAHDAVPCEAGFVSNRLDVLTDGLRSLVSDLELAQQMGKAARAAALERYGLERFLRDWDDLLEEVTA